MKSILVAAALVMSFTAVAQNDQSATETKKVAKKTVAKKAAKKKAKKGAAIENTTAAPVATNANAPAETIQAEAAASVNQSVTPVEVAKPEETKKWGGEVTLSADASAKLAWQDAEQSITGYAAVKYKQDKQNSFAIRQYGTMTAVGVNSAKDAVSTGKAGNTMLVYTRNMGSLFRSDDAASIQYRLTLPTNDQTGFNLAAFSATLALPYTISPKWSFEYGFRLGTGMNHNIDKNSISSSVNNGQIAYSLTDKIQIYQSLGVVNGNLRTIDTNKLYLETGIQAAVSSVFLQFAVAQEHGVGAGATEFKAYNVEETSYNSTLVMSF